MFKFLLKTIGVLVILLIFYYFMYYYVLDESLNQFITFTIVLAIVASFFSLFGRKLFKK